MEDAVVARSYDRMSIIQIYIDRIGLRYATKDLGLKRKKMSGVNYQVSISSPQNTIPTSSVGGRALNSGLLMYTTDVAPKYRPLEEVCVGLDEVHDVTPI